MNFNIKNRLKISGKMSMEDTGKCGVLLCIAVLVLSIGFSVSLIISACR